MGKDEDYFHTLIKGGWLEDESLAEREEIIKSKLPTSFGSFGEEHRWDGLEQNLHIVEK